MADNKPSKEELMKAVADVLDEAINTYSKLEKMDGIDGAQVMQDPSRSHQPGSDEAAGQVDGLKDPNANPVPKGSADVHADGVKGPKEAVLKDGDSERPSQDSDESEEDKKKKKKEQDEKDMYAFKSMASDLEKRGLITKAPDSIKKSDAAPAAPAPAAAAPSADFESLKKSFSDSIESLTKKIGDIAEKVEKISSQPAAPRRGLSGATPLRKSDEAAGSQPTYSKLDALDRLVDLRKSGDKRVDTGLITRVELNKLTQGDVERLNGILV